MKLRHAILPVALLFALPSLAMAERGFQVRDLATLDRVSSPTLSPDGRRVFAKRIVDYDATSPAHRCGSRIVRARRGAANTLTPDGWTSTRLHSRPTAPRSTSSAARNPGRNSCIRSRPVVASRASSATSRLTSVATSLRVMGPRLRSVPKSSPTARQIQLHAQTPQATPGRQDHRRGP